MDVLFKPTPEEKAEFERQEQAAAPQPFDPFKELDADGLTELAIQDTAFGVGAAYHEATKKNPELLKDQKVLQNVADAKQKLRERGFHPADIPGVPTMAHAAKEIAVGLGKNIWNTIFKGGSYLLARPFEALGVASVEGLPNIAGKFPETGIIGKTSKDYYQGLQRDISESGAGMESAVTGLGFQVARGAEKLVDTFAGDPMNSAGDFSETRAETTTPEERVRRLFGEIGELKTMEEVIAGKGEMMQTIGGTAGSAAIQKAFQRPGDADMVKPTSVLGELEAAGKPVRPEQAAVYSAGDFLTFWSFGKGFHLIGKLEPLLTSAAGISGKSAKFGSGAAVVAGQIAQGAGEITKLGATAAESVAKAAPAIGFVAGGIKGAAVGGELIGGSASALGGAALGYKGGQVLKKAIEGGARVATKAGEKIVDWGAQVAGDIPMVSNTAQVVRSGLQVAPAAGIDVARGLGMDIGLAAVTSESPQETAGTIGIGAFFGAAAGAKRSLGAVIGKQLLGPKAYGLLTPVPSTGTIPAMDKMNAEAMSIAPPGVVARFNAVRAFIKGLDPQVDTFTGGEAMVKKALMDMGFDEGEAAFFARQEGFFTIELPTPEAQAAEKVQTDKRAASIAAYQKGGEAGGLRADQVIFDGLSKAEAREESRRNGLLRKAVVFTNIDSAPHEAGHVFQNVLGEAGNRALNEVIKKDYAHIWDAIGENYSGRFDTYDGSGWREFLLDITGFGQVWAKEKILRATADQASKATGETVEPGEVLDMVQADWQAAWDKMRAGDMSGLPDSELAPKNWRGILTEAEMLDASDYALANEIGAEGFDALFKHHGPSMKELSGLVPRLARIVGKFMQLVGGEPLHYEVSEVGKFPLRTATIEATKKAVRGQMAPDVTPLPPSGIGPRPVIRPPGSGGGIPATPEQQAEAAAQAKEIAANAPDTIPAGGTRTTRELLGQIAEAIASRVGIKINYSSAPGEPAAAITANRAARRAVIEFFRSAPAELRSLWEKNFFPERIIRLNSGKLQVLGWAPEVFAANAHRMAGRLTKSQSPYPLDPVTKSFTTEGWKQLYEDTTKFVENQMGGRTGAGDPLVVPAAVTAKDYFKPSVIGTPEGLDQRKADFINLLFGTQIPKTPRITKGKMPLNIAGQEVSAATEPGRLKPTVEPRMPFGEPFEGRTIQEVNPLRAELERAGVDVSGLIEAQQRLNVDNIKEVQTAPEIPQFRGNTLTLAAGFQPQPENPRAIKAAAVRDTETGKIFTGTTHAEVYDAHGEQFNKIPQDGFVDNAGNFLTAEEAFIRAAELKQLSKKDAKTLNQGLESIQFDRKRQFNPPARGREAEDRQPLALRPGGGQRRITITGPDGTLYNARFDGYQEIPGEPPGWEAQITPETRLPFQGEGAQRSTTYKSSIEEAGLKIVEELPTPEQWEASQQSEPLTGQFQPSPEVQKIADEFAGRTLSHGVRLPVVNTELARKIADFYEAAEHAPADATVKMSYDALRDETLKQFDAIKAAGYTIEPWQDAGEPYKSSADMTSDVRDNKHLYFKTTGTEVRPDNLMADFNDVFRAVHDFFGHAAEGYQFGPRGELAAWNAHSEMYPPAAQGALASETLAQNLWVNFGKHLEGKTIPLPERPFAEQKNILVPAELIAEAKAQFSPPEENRGSGFGPKQFVKNLLTTEQSHALLVKAQSLENSIKQKQDRMQTLLPERLSPTEILQVEKLYNIPKMREEVASLKNQLDSINEELIPHWMERDVFWSKSAKENIENPPGPKEFREPGKISLDDFQPDLDRFKSGKYLDGPAWVLPDGSGVHVPIGARYHDDAVAGFLEFGNAVDEAQNRGAMRVATFDSPRQLADLGGGQLGISVTRKPTESQMKFVQRLLNEETAEGNAQFDKISIDIQNEAGDIISGKNFDSFDKGKALRFLRNLGKEPPASAQLSPGRPDDPVVEPKLGRGAFLPPNRIDEESRKLLTARGTFAGERRLDEEARKLLSIRGTTPKDKRAGERAAVVPERSLATPADVQKFFREESDYAILTATREAVGDAMAEENRKSNDRLFEELEKRGYKNVIPVAGTYKGVDQGENFLVLGIKPKEALALGQKYGQESVVVKQGLLHSADESVIPAKLENIVVGPEAEKLEFFSTLPNKVSFSIPFDFEGERATAQYMPKAKDDPLKFLGMREHQASKAWIMPDGTVQQLGAQWHHHWLDDSKEVQAKYGLQIPPFEGGDATRVRESALKKGFARVNLSDAALVVEMREKDWRKYRSLVEDLIDRNMGAIDRFRVYLLDEKIKEIQKSYAGMFFDLDTKKQKMARMYEIFSDDAQRELSGQFAPQRRPVKEMRLEGGQFWLGRKGLENASNGHEQWVRENLEGVEKSDTSTEENYDIAHDAGYVRVVVNPEWGIEVAGSHKIKSWKDLSPAARKAVEDLAFEKNLPAMFEGTDVIPKPRPFESGGQYQPPRAEQEQLFGGRELLSTHELSKMSRKELQAHFPEAIVPANLQEGLPSRITESPLHKNSDDPVGAFADKLVEFAKQYEDDPVFQSGKRWYSEFTPMLKKYFGADAPLMAELLAATSPQTNPTVNFGYALDALEGLKSGRFKKIIAKFNQGMERLNDGSWEKSAATPARFMADWVEKYDLKPKQSNGKLYGQHSRPVLQVFARVWLAQNKGPKTRNFVENLLGTSDEATIDLWADRTMRRIGYESAKARWRIMPQNGTEVSGVDFRFSQKAFRAAADQLGMKPSELQGALWFAEKLWWNEHGWAQLDLGDYRREITKTGLLQQGVEHRTATRRAEEKTRPSEATELPLVEKRKLR